MITPDAVEAVVDQVGGWLDELIGLRPEATLRGRLRRCVRDEVAGYDDDPDVYLRTLRQDRDAMQSLVNRVTVQESGFFRHPDHFDVLASQILPALDEPVAIWSAGCGNGQEAYSLAMLLEESGTRGSILASDLSTAALGRAAAARYTPREITGIAPFRRARHLSRDGDRWRINTGVRARVATMRHNLTTELPSQVSGCQVVFCRNVLIYFAPKHTTAFLNRLADALAPGAYLFLGGAESLWQATDRFQAVRMGDSFVYRHADRATRAPRKPEPPARGSAVASTERRRAADVPGPSPRRRAGDAVVSLSVSPAAVPASPVQSPAAVLAATGRKSLAEGDHAAAVVAFRKWAYLAPEDALAALHLGLALEASGDAALARRAFGVSRAIVLRVGSGDAESELKGFAAGELLRLLDAKQALLE